MDFAAKEYKSRERIFVASPGGTGHARSGRARNPEGVPAARLPPPRRGRRYRAISRALPRRARSKARTSSPSVLFTLRAALVSPKFLFLFEPPNPTPDLRRIDPYALASRLSYFLWGSMPDELLFDLAAAGKLHEPEVVRALIPRMLRNEQSLDFAKRFVDQWLRTRELDSDKAPDAKLFPAWAADEDLRSDIRLQPVLFFHEMLKRESLRAEPDRFHLIRPHPQAGPAFRRGDQDHRQRAAAAVGRASGILHPWRRARHARRACRLVLSLSDQPRPARRMDSRFDAGHAAAAAARRRAASREAGLRRSAQDRARDAHRRIAKTRFARAATAASTRSASRSRTTIRLAAGAERKPVSRSITPAELPDGTPVKGPVGLKQALLDRKELFVRNLTSKMLGYALGRGLTLKDSCTVDRIVAELKEHDYRAQKLVELIILSVPFQYQAPVRRDRQKEQNNNEDFAQNTSPGRRR